MMKYVIILLVLFTTSLFAQDVKNEDKDVNYTYVSLVPNVLFYRGNGLNYVIDRYNETRNGDPGEANITDKMNKFHLMAGWGIMGGHMNNKWGNGGFADIYLGGTTAKSSASGIDVSGNPAYRNLTFKTFTYSTTGGLNLIQTELFDLGAITTIDLMWGGISTVSTTQTEEYTAQQLFGFGMGFGGHLVVFPMKRVLPLSVFARAYYMFDFMPTYYDALSEAINPGSYTTDIEEQLKGTMSNFNLKVGLSLTIFSRKQEARVKLEQKEGTKTKKTTGGFQ